MTGMAFLSDTTALVDLVLALVGVEALGLYAFRRWMGRGPSFAALLANLGAGVALVCALRAALSGAAYGAIAAILAVSLAAHVTDLWLRWRG
jgi:anti-sigma factor RsiW